jgi:hypothetical protein
MPSLDRNREATRREKANGLSGDAASRLGDGSAIGYRFGKDNAGRFGEPTLQKGWDEG